MKLILSKGTKDYLPEEQIVRENIKAVLQKVFRRYGFSPLETPILEMKDVLASKYAGGAEILKEMFTLTDQGKRELALRYDLTVPLARVIGMNPSLRMPFKRYEMGRVFRDGPIKLGRLREFWQCDVDVIGSDDVYFDAELLALAADGLNALGLSAFLEVNDRKILNGIIEDAGIPVRLANTTILSIDKLKKVGQREVRKELEEKGLDASYFDRLFGLFDVSGSNEEMLDELDKKLKSKVAKEGIDEMRKIFAYLMKMNVNADIRFLPSLARGLEYYTGMIFEGFVEGSEMSSSVCAGGRWDNMIGQMVGRDKVPATGFAFGLDALYTALKSKQKKMTLLDVWLVPIKTFDECLPVLNELRINNVNADIDVKQRSISKNLDFANKEGIPFALLIGKQELGKNKVKLKDMVSGKEELLDVKKAINVIKSKPL